MTPGSGVGFYPPWSDYDSLAPVWRQRRNRGTGWGLVPVSYLSPLGGQDVVSVGGGLTKERDFHRTGNEGIGN